MSGTTEGGGVTGTAKRRGVADGRNVWRGPLFLAGLPVLLVAAQPDLGTALIIGLISATVVIIARLRMKTLGGIVVAGALAIAPLWEYALHDYQRNRVLAFINPALDPATAWQPRQAMNAVGSGRFIGKGFLQGTQIRLRSLPALWTDFPGARKFGAVCRHELLGAPAPPNGSLDFSALAGAEFWL